MTDPFEDPMVRKAIAKAIIEQGAIIDVYSLDTNTVLPAAIPRTVFEAMAPEVKEKVLRNYWIPKDDTLPVLHKSVDAYRECTDGRVMWNVPFERFCAYDGAKMYKCKGTAEFYCPVCEKLYADRNWDIQGD